MCSLVTIAAAFKWVVDNELPLQAATLPLHTLTAVLGHSLLHRGNWGRKGNGEGLSTNHRLCVPLHQGGWTGSKLGPL